MNTKLIRSLSDDLDSARALLAKLKDELALIDMRKGQDCCSISCAGRTLSVTAWTQDSYYMPRLVNGMEMVQLGLRKYWQAMIDSQADVVAAKEAALRDAINHAEKVILKAVA
jgi:hypothetical protein